METPWWYLDKDIDMDDELNIVKTVEKEILVLTANNEIKNDDVVQSIVDAHPNAQPSTKNCSHIQKLIRVC